jgi:branched-chain amino acid transport system substrate-binding protein
MSFTRWVILLALTILSVVALGRPALAAGGPPAAPEWKVGAYLSLSGEDAAFGIFSKEGIELAIDEVNKAGGVKGRPIKVLFEDDKSNPQEATNKVLQLIDRDKVVALLGEVTSSRSKAGGIVANKKHVPMITPTATNPEVTRVGPFVFRVCFTDDVQAKAAAAFVVDELGKKRVAVLYATDDLYSSGLAAEMRAAVVARGATIVADKGFLKKETNFTTYLNEIKDSHPDIIYAPIYYNQMTLIARQAKAIGLGGDMFVGGDGWDADELVNDAGEELEGAFFTNFYAPDVPWASARDFRTHYNERFKHDPSSNAAMGYDAAKLLADAIGRAKDDSPEAIRDAIQATRGFQGATGPITIDDERNAAKPVIVVRVHDKKFTYFSAVKDTALKPPAAAPRADDQVSTPGIASKIWGALETGLAQGAMIALVALGYTMVYGILKLINFAHSEIFMMGAYAGLFFIGGLGGEASPLFAGVVGTLGAMLLAGGLGVLVERIAYAPLRARGGKSANSRITPLVTALGMSVLLQNLAQLLFTAQYRGYPRLLPIQHTRKVIFITAITVMTALQFFVHRTWTGKAMRALSMNMEAARLMGIRTGRIIALTFTAGSMLAAVGAVLYCLDQSQVYPTMGVTIGTRAFVAAVIGGIGSIPGAMLGGVLIGVIGEMTKLTSYSGLQDVLVFTVLIAVLLVKPTGLLGKAGIEKV